MESKNIDYSVINEIMRETIYDNSEMKQYYEYLSLIRFSRASNKINHIINDRAIKIDSLEEYNKKCLK
jgi:hypothetical protein